MPSDSFQIHCGAEIWNELTRTSLIRFVPFVPCYDFTQKLGLKMDEHDLPCVGRTLNCYAYDQAVSQQCALC